jgi:Helitron helicase-like domain at N-terminus
MSTSPSVLNENDPPLPVEDHAWWSSFTNRMNHSRWRPPQWCNHCSYCGALLLNAESNGFCCSKGKKITPRLPPLPQRLLSISKDRNLSPYSRRLNSLFSFTAIGSSKGFQSFQTGVWNVAITGRTYHRIFDISNTEHCLHWYLYDEQDRNLEAIDRKIPLSWINAISHDLDDYNPYVHHLRHFSTTWQHNPTAISALELFDASPSGDFAAVMHANDCVDVQPRSIVIWHNSENDPSFIPIFSRHYEPLQYPVLFPHGTLGWGLTSLDNDQLSNNLNFTQREWYKNQLLCDDRFLLFGRLTSEYLCDMYSRIEEERLLFIRKGRLHQAHEVNPDVEDEHIDIHLPISFLGSREWSSSETADSLALAREFGPPTFFITMTCNSDWPEIVNRLQPGETAYNIPIIVARAFKQRLHRLLNILNTKFGTLLYVIHIIEFQKRGFPHAHIVVKVIFFTPFKFCVTLSLIFPYCS